MYQPETIPWAIDEVLQACEQPTFGSDNIDELVAAICQQAKEDDQILVMSNGGFGGIHDKLIRQLTLMAEKG